MPITPKDLESARDLVERFHEVRDAIIKARDLDVVFSVERYGCVDDLIPLEAFQALREQLVRALIETADITRTELKVLGIDTSSLIIPDQE